MQNTKNDKKSCCTPGSGLGTEQGPRESASIFSFFIFKNSTNTFYEIPRFAKLTNLKLNTFHLENDKMIKYVWFVQVGLFT